MRRFLSAVRPVHLSRLCATGLLCLCLLPSVASAQAGQTDTVNFSQGAGKYAFAIGGSTANDARAMLVQPDSKIVLAGGCQGSGNSDFCVARLTASGQLDATFVGPSGTSGGGFLLPVGSANDGASAVALQSDGRIVLGGTCAGASFNGFCLVRLNSDGSLDASFNGPDAAGTGEGTGHGKFLLRIGASGHESLAGMAIQPDGKIVVAGTCRPATVDLFCVARLNPNGTFDASFDGPDAAGTGVGSGNGRFAVAVGTGSNAAAALAVQPDGKILVVGTCEAGATGLDFCAARFMSSDGRFDLAFDGGNNISTLNGNGKVIIPVTAGASSDYASAVALRPDGYVLIAGSCWNGSNYDFCGTRLEIQTGRSITFWSTGFPGFALPIGTGDDFATSIAVQPDGKFVLTGQCQNGAVYQFCAVRYHAGGDLDVTFDGDADNGNGRFMVPPLLSDDHANTMAIQANAIASSDELRLLIAGSCRIGTVTMFCITRLTYGEHAARNCTMDLDGDGRMLATVDGLIMTRVMLGITGNAVVAGISFPAAAKRRTWTDIQQYLVRQCGFWLPLDLAGL